MTDFHTREIMASVEFDFKSVVCKKHKDQNTILYCSKCDIFVCPKCISAKHTKHNFIDTESGYKKKIDIIQRSTIKLQWSIRDVKRKQEALIGLKTNESAKYRKTKSNIEKQKQAWLKVISRHFDAIEEELNQDYELLVNSIDKDIEELSKYTDDVETKLEEAENFIKTGNKDFFYVKPKKLSFIFENGKCTPPLNSSSYDSVPKFVSEEIIPQFRVGKLISQKSAAEVSLSINKQFFTDMSTVGLVTPCPDGSIWISNTIDTLVQRVQPQEQDLEILQSVTAKVYGMAAFDDYDILVSVDGPVIKLIKSTSGQIEYTSFNVKPFETTAIHNTLKAEVLVGGFRASQERGVVFKFDTDGNTEKLYEFDKQNQPLFRYPRSIASAQNRVIYVADNHPKDGIGRVVVIEEKGEVNNIYLGHHSVNQSIPFRPVSIVTTLRTNVIVSDFDSHTFHILDSYGYFLTCYNATDLGILYPFSLGISSEGNVYVGCSRGKGNIDKAAKLYEIELLET